MQQSNQEIDLYQTDEIDLGKVTKILKKRRWFILGFTGIVTLLAIVYVLFLPPKPYLSTASFVSPNQISVMTLNKFPLTNETSESIFISYLRKLSSTDFKEKVFYENDYLTVLNPENEPIDNIEDYVSGFLNSISIKAPFTKQAKNEIIGNLLERPYSMSMEGSDGKIISRFLNKLIVSANSETINDFINITNQKIAIRLDQISNERQLLLSVAQQDRLSQIVRIKEEDTQKIREINNLIDALRYKAKQDRLNQIQILTVAAKLASSLGIIENNLEKISESVSNFNLNIAINDEENDLPEWYLYGEKALLKRVELLESRTNDDPFISELVTLKNQLMKVQNNNTLKTLEERQDDIPFLLATTNEAGEETNLILELDAEKILLESFDPSPNGINAMQLTQPPVATKIPNSRLTIVVISFVAGFALSIFLALMLYFFKEDDTEPTTKTIR